MAGRFAIELCCQQFERRMRRRKLGEKLRTLGGRHGGQQRSGDDKPVDERNEVGLDGREQR